MISGSRKICYLIGKPLSHSMSPAIHGIIYSSLGMDWQYLLHEIESPEKIEDFISGVRSSDRCAGFNVTIPYKTRVMEYLEETEPAALITGAVNTVIKKESILKGVNTDWEGFRDDLILSLGISSLPSTVMIVGAGGAARAAVYALTHGFSSVPEQIFIYDIDSGKAEKLKEDFTEFSLETYPDLCPEEIVSRADILINATPVGMNPGPPPVDLKSCSLKENLCVYDMVYNRKTELLDLAGQKGLASTSGSGMLVRQGARAFELWSGREVPEKIKKEMIEYVKNAVSAAEMR